MNDSNTVDELFIYAGRQLEKPRVLEMGTKRSNPAKSTMVGRDWFPGAGEILGTDIDFGIDVDFVANAHTLFSDCAYRGYLNPENKNTYFDIIISRSVLEHLERPWIAVEEMGDCLKSGGLCYVQTHFAFPIHGYPSDFFRFSTEALKVLFSEESGFKVVKSDYTFPCSVVCPTVPGTTDAPAYLNSNIFAIKL